MVTTCKKQDGAVYTGVCVCVCMSMCGCVGVAGVVGDGQSIKEGGGKKGL